MAAPEIAKTVRQMFESGKVVGRREVKKTKSGASELASESGVFENEPTTIVEGVVRSGDVPTSDVDQVNAFREVCLSYFYVCYITYIS